MTDTANNGTGTEAQTTQDAATAGGQTPQNTGTETRTFTQEEVNRLIAKELKPFKEIKSEYEKIQKVMKDREELELSELEKLKKQLDETTPFKDRYEKLENTLKEYLEQELERIPEDMRSLVPDLSVENQLAYISKNRDKLYAKTNQIGGAARTTQSATSSPDPIREKAKLMAIELAGNKGEEYVKKLEERLYAQYKSQ